MPSAFREERICLGIASFTSELRRGALSLKQVFAFAKRLGFKKIELCDRTILDDEAALGDLCERLAEFELKLCAIDVRNDFTSRDEAKRLQAIAHVERWIDICASLDVKIARIWLGRDSADDRAYGVATACLLKVSEHARRMGVVLALENHGGISDNPDSLARVINTVASPYLAACPDFGWFAPDDRLDGVRKLMPFAAHVHAKTHRFDGAGSESDIDYAALGLIVRASGYCGMFAVEYEGVGVGDERLVGIETTARLLEAHFDEPLPVPRPLQLTLGMTAPPSETPSPPPYISRIRTENLFDQARPVLLNLVEDFAAKPETVGVVLLGGLADRAARRFVDRHSDLDLALVLSLPDAEGYTCPKRFAREHPEQIPSWLPAFSFEVNVDGLLMEVNCHQLILEIERRPERGWLTAKQEAYRCTGEIVYDPTRAIQQLIDAKCAFAPPTDEVMVLASQLPWYGWINPVRQLDRGFPVNARLLLNESVALLLKLLSAANDRFWPHLKWQYEMSRDLPWLPPDYERRLSAVLEAAMDTVSLRLAIAEMHRLSNDVLDTMKRRGLISSSPFEYVSAHIDVDRQLPIRPVSCVGHAEVWAHGDRLERRSSDPALSSTTALNTGVSQDFDGARL